MPVVFAEGSRGKRITSLTSAWAKHLKEKKKKGKEKILHKDEECCIDLEQKSILKKKKKEKMLVEK